MFMDYYFKATYMAKLKKIIMSMSMDRVFNGLNGEIIDVVELKQYVDLDELVELAEKVENQSKRKQQTRSG